MICDGRPDCFFGDDESKCGEFGVDDGGGGDDDESKFDYIYKFDETSRPSLR